MTPRDQYLELKKLGFTIGMISKQTGINRHKLNNIEFKNMYFFSPAEKAAFTVYYKKAKELSSIYGERLAEYLAKEQAK